ncbi:MAG TPA: PH domain-containing protein [Opitutus sp.]|nr:PH domain-containing protein [Opitutus sp.]
MSTTPSEESLVWRGSPSQWTNFGAFFFALVVAGFIVAASVLTAAGPLILIALVLPVGYLFARWLETRSEVYEVTTERIRCSTGIFSRRRSELELYRVRDYTVVEPFLLRLIGRGNIVIESADRSTPVFVMHAVPDVNTLKDRIRTHTELMRQRRGVRDLEINPQ